MMLATGTAAMAAIQATPAEAMAEEAGMGAAAAEVVEDAVAAGAAEVSSCVDQNTGSQL